MNAILHVSASLALVLAIYLGSAGGLPRTSIRLLAVALATLAALNVMTALQLDGVTCALFAARPGLAALLPPLLYLHIAVAARDELRLVPTDCLHLLGPLAAIFLRISPWSGLSLDVLILVLQVFYLLCLVMLARGGEAIFAGLGPALAALFDRWRRVVSGFMLAVIALDLLILLQLGGGEVGASRPWLFALVGVLLVLGFAYLLISGLHRAGPLSWVAERHRAPTPEQAALIEQIESDFAASRDYLDPNLTLQRLARRKGVTARAISAAINDRRQCNYNQWLNGFRVAEAKCLLQNNPELAVTEVMLAAGFQNKSTFNAAFRAVAGMSPSAWRELHSQSEPRENG